jgi:hypothetical protein
MYLPPSHPWLRLSLDELEEIVGACVEVRVVEDIPEHSWRFTPAE